MGQPPAARRGKEGNRTMSEPADIPAFAWYRLHAREVAALLVLLLVFAAVSSIALLRRGLTHDIEVTAQTQKAAKVRINRAGIAELSALPGIGVRKAERIVEARSKQPIEDLAALSKAAGGVSAANLERMKPFVEFEP